MRDDVEEVGREEDEKKEEKTEGDEEDCDVLVVAILVVGICSWFKLIFGLISIG